MNVNWKNQSMRNTGLLYQDYRNIADVTDADGKYAGTILELPNGLFRGSTRSQVNMGEFATETEAADAIARGNEGIYG